MNWYDIKIYVQEKNSVIRDLSPCVIKKFDGYVTLKVEIKAEQKKQHVPIDIVYIPVKGHDETINCYFTNKLHLASIIRSIILLFQRKCKNKWKKLLKN